MTNCFRHDGSTGVMVAGDKSRNIIITFLCNAVHPDEDNYKVE